MMSHEKYNGINVLRLSTGRICWKMKQNGSIVKKGCRPLGLREALFFGIFVS